MYTSINPIHTVARTIKALHQACKDEFSGISVSQVSYLCTFFKYSLPIAEICTVQYVQVPGSIYFVVDRELPPPHILFVYL